VLGFTPFAVHPSHAVTALQPPAGLAPSAVVKRLRETHGMVVAGGQDRLKDSILRAGHMGAYDLADIQALLGALEECVHALGGPGSTGNATRLARAAWDSA
jgi:aspartate aminotransferase-like enzyme